MLLHDPTSRVRWAALHALQCVACKLVPIAVAVDLVGAIAALALTDPSVKVRRVAAWELAQQCPDPQARTALEQVCVHEVEGYTELGNRPCCAAVWPSITTV